MCGRGMHGRWGVGVCKAGGACMVGGMCGRGHEWWGACVVGGMHAPSPADTTRYDDAVNEKAVCNLLECILVYDLFLQGQGGHGSFSSPPPIGY